MPRLPRGPRPASSWGATRASSFCPLIPRDQPAAAIIMRMPNALTRTCIQNAPDTSTMAKWAGERQKHAEAEDFQRMLAAHDRRPQPSAISGPASRAARTAPSPPPAPGNARSAGRRDWSCRSDRSALRASAARSWLRPGNIPGQRDDEREQEIGDRDRHASPASAGPSRAAGRRPARTRRRTRTATARRTD